MVAFAVSVKNRVKRSCYRPYAAHSRKCPAVSPAKNYRTKGENVRADGAESYSIRKEETMSALDYVIKRHLTTCQKIDLSMPCNCGRDEAAAELAQLRASLDAARIQAWQEIEDWARSNGFVLIAERAGYLKNAAVSPAKEKP